MLISQRGQRFGGQSPHLVAHSCLNSSSKGIDQWVNTTHTDIHNHTKKETDRETKTETKRELKDPKDLQGRYRWFGG